jgi:FKBP-type peptidyl-prolyl cis-trans isomerase FklB
MKRNWLLLLGVALAAIALGCHAQELKTQKDKVSYGIGVMIGNQMKSQNADVDPDVVARGLKDLLTGAKLQMTDEEIHTTLAAFQAEMRQKQEEANKVAGEKNKKDGEAYLADNKKKDGVVTLPDGLQYKILKAGEGKKPGADDSVVCNYKGTLIDGTEFDSSYKRGTPATFPVQGVIKGWTEALQLMPVGSKWQLFIPSDLAYGERGMPPCPHWPQFRPGVRVGADLHQRQVGGGAQARPRRQKARRKRQVIGPWRLAMGNWPNGNRQVVRGNLRDLKMANRESPTANRPQPTPNRPQPIANGQSPAANFQVPGSFRPARRRPKLAFPMSLNILRICAYWRKSWFTSWTLVPEPRAMRLRRLPLMASWWERS